LPPIGESGSGSGEGREGRRERRGACVGAPRHFFSTLSTDCRAWTNGEKLSDFCFADDIALLAENKEILQQMIDSTATISRKMGMQMNAVKTEMQFPGRGDQKFSIHLSGQLLAQTDNFV